MKPISRRAILRGAAGAAIALPWLEAMLPRKARAATPPKRFIVMFSPNGTLPTQWTPTGSETSFTLSPILTPLAPHQGDLVIIEGLLQEGGGGDGHQNGIGGMLTGSPLNPGPFAGVGAPPAGWATGPSIDQRIVQALAAPTPFQSLELGVQVGAADNWGRMIYQAANQPLPPTDDPAQVYTSVFSDLHTDPVALAHLRARHKSILDAVGGEYTRIGSQLGSADKQRLDAHLNAVREIETRLTTSLVDNNPACHDPASTTSTTVAAQSNDSFPAVGALQMDLLTMALACDLTRVASMQWSRSVSQVRFTWLNVPDGHHDLSHRSDDDSDAVNKLTLINTWYAQQMADLIARLKNTPDGAGGTLFDNTLILWSNELAKGNTHSRQDAPYVLAGNAGGGLRTGRFVSYEGQGLPHNNMMVSILNALDIPDTTFGKADWCSGPLVGLL
ncbi:MAG TPA: DUF1552 domain-containing protein [Polyangia bacterium]|nr:DUF1552 domain-containing protein [Polyangia bacterium]